MVGKTILDKKIVQFQKPTYSFGVISDIHINRTIQDAEGDLRKAFSAFRNRGITRVFCCGDISTNHTEDELITFKQIKDEYPEITFRSCTGNHDVQFTEQQWQTYIGHGFTNGSNQCMYTEEINGDVFCLLPIRSWENARPYSSGMGDDPFEEFYQALINDLSVGGKRVFLFLHYPVNSSSNSWQYPGLKLGQFYGFGDTSEDNAIIKSISFLSIYQGNCKSIVMFSGHSHYAFDIQNFTSDFKDLIFLQKDKLAYVHVPSLTVPRDQNMNTIQSGHPELQPVQGYVVDVYPDYVKLTGLEFNLKLFDADQRKGLVKIENRYVAECEKKESNIINYLGIYFKEAVNQNESYFEIGRLQLKDSQLNDIDIYTGSQYIGFAVDDPNTYYDTPGNGCYYRNHEVEMPQNMCMMNDDSIVIGYASNPANKKFPFLSPYKLEIPLNLSNTIYYTQRCGRNGSLSSRKVKSFSLMGSKDGVNWFSLYDYNQTPPTQDCVPFFTNELISPSQTQLDLSMFIKTNA